MANRDEVEEFLRRAALRRQQAEAQARAQAGQRPGQPQQPPWAQPPQQQQVAPSPFAPAAQQPAPPPAWAQPQQRRPANLAEVIMLQPAPAEVVEADLIEITDNVSNSVDSHMRGTREIADHASRLGAEVDQRDDMVAARLHQTFDHQVGDLLKSTMEAGAASPSAAAREAPLPGAAGIASMLINPHNVRNAVILNEILKRPDFDW